MLEQQVEQIIHQAKAYLHEPKLEQKIWAAFEFAKQAHEGQKRLSGEAYITHPVAATEHLMPLHPDLPSIQACFLHDVIEDTPVTAKEIEKKFGATVATLTSGLAKLGKIKYRGEERAIENLKKMFLAMSKDLRVILIKLCDRLHNMETLHFHPKPEKVVRIAQETLNIYAPIAARLGIYQIKDQLEDLCFKILYPYEYEEILRQLNEKSSEREAFILYAREYLQRILQERGLPCEILSRVKTPYSIFKKMQVKHATSMRDLYDIFALRVIVADKAACYATLGIIHEHFKPVPHRFKDYIAVPKMNNYQSLHTTVIGLGRGMRDQPTEIQIRTQEMNDQAEFGVAAHFLYKEKSGPQDTEYINWMKDLAQASRSHKDHSEFMHSITMDFFNDRIFVLTPKGDVKDLPVGSTPVDFAYAIHTAVGNRCKGAKVDGKIVPLSYELKNGEVVEILTRTDPQPNQYWLSFVKTNEARGKIRSWFLTQNREDMVKLGKELLNKQLERLGHGSLDPDLSILTKMGDKDLPLKEREQLLEMIGNGSVNPVTIIRKIFPPEDFLHSAKSISKPAGNIPPKETPVLVAGEPNITYKLSACCHPQPPEKLVGYVTRGGAVSIHRAVCRMLANLKRERFLEAQWQGFQQPVLQSRLVITMRDEIGSFKEILEVMVRFQINISGITTLGKDIQKGGLKMQLDISVQDYEELDRLISTLDVMDSVVNIQGKILG